jgi:hypothetical protein
MSFFILFVKIVSNILEGIIIENFGIRWFSINDYDLKLMYLTVYMKLILTHF